MKTSPRTPGKRSQRGVRAVAALGNSHEKDALVGIALCYRQLSHYYAELAEATKNRIASEDA